MASSGTSGPASEAQKAAYQRRAGAPSGPRSEAQKAGLHGDNASPRRELPLDAEAVRAFITGDSEFFTRQLGPGQWEATMQRLITEVTTRGGFRWDDLKHRDDDVARVAWGRLGRVAEAVGVPEERWIEILRGAGWEGWTIPDEGEGSDGGA